ncbi:hybrid sensor histidine kinase/response regulator [Mucilaginibacter sp. AK015]|uniref:hybrid sensor histidine kinase/response regulator n=1 Tax=Mucilaginibacter sp. AK015 TaxID=2723072 RepID=UPI00161A668B|nr:hybrid sensor histidine kinase/response regulator [Mucilaginibacter sp. AK015]MBB5394028.1 signal transduction histidine kinase/ligand-binding sensor domain-containing protein/DNA-binding response OmpR family regulator [Mucilaginibacter sp. AK015]
MYKHLIFFILLLCTLSGFGQNQSLKFEHIGTGEGLSQINVASIIQDSRGFMWIGTRDGLNKYDGYTFTTYRHDAQSPQSLSSSMVADIAEDKEGNIWVATIIGLNKLERKSGRIIQYKHDDKNSNTLANNILNKLVVDEKNNIWIAGQGGLDYLDTRANTVKHYKHIDNDPGSLSDNKVSFVYQDAALNIWAGTFAGGLHLLNKKTGTFKKFQYDLQSPKSISSNNISCIFEDKKQRLWVGTQNAGLNMYDAKSNTFVRYQHTENVKNTISSNNIYCLNSDENGNLWIGSDNGGLCILNPETGVISYYQHDDIDKNSINGNTLYSICKDRLGNMWLGAYSGGINVFKRSTESFAHYRHSSLSNSLSNDFVLALYEDNERNLWVGTDGGGLNKFDNKNGTIIHYKKNNTSNSIAGNYVLTVNQDFEGDFWIGTWADGLSIFNPKTNVFTNLKNNPNNPNSLSGNNIYALIQSKDHTAWIGTYNTGLSHYNKKTGRFINYKNDRNDPHSLSSDRVYSLLEDSNDNLWVGTFDGGLNLLDRKTGKFTRFVFDSKKNSISNDNIPDIFEDSKGNLWLSTFSGLNLFNPVTKHFTVFTKKDGLPSDIIYAAREDDEGKLWISTNNGLSSFDPVRRIFKNYTIEDGLQDNEFKSHSAFKGKDDRLYFGGINGFNAFTPGQILKPQGFAPLVITAFRLFNKNVAPAKDAKDPSPLKQDISDTRSITLNHKQSVISLEFAALDFTSTDKKRYAYILEGFDKEWNFVGARNTATYTNLPAGTYVFKLKYQNTTGAWSPVTTGLEIISKPPFWLTWWFKTLALLFVGLLIYAIFIIRLRAIKAQKAILEKQVEERTVRLAQMTNDERVLREDAEKAREDAEKANKAKSIFLATMSHEIRTPMNGVMGMATLLANTPLSSEQQEYTETIKTCGDTLLNVINDILDFSKIESGNMELDEQDFDLRDCIEAVLDVFAEKAARANLDLVYQVEHNVPSQIIADAFRLRQVLINLVGNAIKFTSKGEVFICVKLKGNQDKHFDLLFEIRDTGIGIPPNKIGKLFKAFSQVDSSTTRKYGGTGLGLAISEKLVNLMGGDISVKSQVGKGTTFSFNIAAKAGVKAQRNYVHLNAAEVQNKRILVVDDNSTNRDILEEQLKQWNFIPVMASSGMDALQQLENNKPVHLVISDMNMPGIDGVELARKIREQSQVPIILLTSMGNEQSRKNAHLFNVALTKPTKHQALYKHIIEQLKLNSNVNTEVQAIKTPFSEDFAKHHPMSILIAEDNAINQKLAKYILNKMGYKPDIVENGHEAINAMISKKYNLVLMDVQMPEMDGLEATRFVRQNMEHQPAIIAMTANAMTEDKEVCLKAGMNGYLSKPLKLQELMDTLAGWDANKGV